MIPDCKNMIHPFLTDSGTSQGQRLSDDLLSGKAQIDGRSLADLLDFFVQLSRHVNYYDDKLNVRDWQPFFGKSLPFVLASVIKYDQIEAEQKLTTYKKRFDRRPSSGGLYLLLRYTYTNIIKKINGWQLQVANSGIPIDTVMEKLMKDKLSLPVKNFIKYANASSHWYGTARMDFSKLMEKKPSPWLLEQGDLYLEDDTFRKEGNTRRKRLIALYNKVYRLIQIFHDVIRLLSVSAEQSLGQSLLPLKDELKEKHSPHLAILFAFIKLFQYLQGDLNGYTKKHLDFFYKKVLLLKPKQAEPDKVHLVLDIQQQLDKYLFKKGLLFKDGKDNNKAEIYFAAEDEIVVNKAQVTDQRTLFLSQLPVRGRNVNNTCENRTIVEGVYMAPDSTKANGIDKEFKDGLPSRATLGDKWSKYIDPENKFTYPYPNARLGFILASPVLLLNEGTRKITISLSCQLQKDYCDSLIPAIGIDNPCCDKETINPGITPADRASNCLPTVPSANLVNQVRTVLGNTYYYISQPLIAALVKKGISKDLKERLQNILLIKHLRSDQVTGTSEEIVDPSVCFCGWEEKLFENTLPSTIFEPLIGQPGLEIIKEFIYPRKAFSVLFSGEKEWIMPLSDDPTNLDIQIKNYVAGTGNFILEFVATILPEQKAITFYNAEALKEDFNTNLPLAKIELDDKIKLLVPVNTCQESDTSCCDRELVGNNRDVSLYHFFREVKVLSNTKIDVKVCGLKNFVVQNEESLQDVNAPIYPFGTRPQIIDFDIKNPLPQPLPNPAPDINLVGPNFYIGSMEIFGKKWNQVDVNIGWKDKPSNFNDYYKGYIVRKNYHICPDLNDNTHDVFGLNECDFQMNLAVLENGVWVKEKLNPPHTNTALNLITNDNNRLLFNTDTSLLCSDKTAIDQTIKIFHIEGGINSDPQFDLTPQFNISTEPLKSLVVSTRHGFLRINLQNQDFLHKDYSYVLARQMMAFGRYPSLINEAVYDEGGVPQVFDISIFFGNIGPKIIEVAGDVVNSAITDILDELIQIISDKIDSGVNVTLLNDLLDRCQTLLVDVTVLAGISIADLFTSGIDIGSLPSGDQDTVNGLVKDFVTDLFDLLKTNLAGIEDDLKAVIRNKFEDLLDDINVNGFFTGLFGEKEVIIPNEPWTPIIRTISIDYTATATSTDIDLIHLYPYTGTYKAEELEQQPMLFPTFCEEGNLFIGLQNLVPGTNVSILFQLAEATADSESERESLVWYYLENNEWKLLRTGFEILKDDTDGLTTSGIIKFAMPANMTFENSVLPKGLYWIKAAIPCKSRSVSEIIGMHTQAIRASFTNEDANDKLRLIQPLEANSVSKLKDADSAVKKIMQPYESFGGRVPEEEGHFYLRVSELLRHKNRAIQKFDYERLVLEAFPKIFKVKCINHTYALDAGQYINDFTIAPGYVLIAVIPDLNQLKAAESFEPKVPVSLLEQIESYLRKIISPFVRLRIMNPRYEKVNFCIRVKLLPGKDEVYYKDQLHQDTKTFLAPWAIGEYEKLAFGQPVHRSDIIRFLESRDYIEYIIDLRMIHEDDKSNNNEPSGAALEINPITARSILVAGSVDVCIDHPGCETWCECDDVAGNDNKPCCDHPAVPVHEVPLDIIK